MKPAIVYIVLSYFSQGTNEQMFCDAVAICPVGAQSCTVVPTEKCWGTYDPEQDELRGRWDMHQCLTSEVLKGKKNVGKVLGCSIGQLTADVDASALQSKGR